MLEEEESDLKRRMADNGVKDETKAHFMETSEELWSYEKRLCEKADLKPMPESSRKIFNAVIEIRRKDPTDYKSIVFEIHPDGEISHSKEKRRRI